MVIDCPSLRAIIEDKIKLSEATCRYAADGMHVEQYLPADVFVPSPIEGLALPNRRARPPQSKGSAQQRHTANAWRRSWSIARV
jgi:hypothetical protein